MVEREVHTCHKCGSLFTSEPWLKPDTGDAKYCSIRCASPRTAAALSPATLDAVEMYDKKAHRADGDGD